MRKQEQYYLIEAHRPKEKSFKIYAILKAFGHTLLRLPPYMYDLNAIELAWAKMKRIIPVSYTHLDAYKRQLHTTSAAAPASISRGYKSVIIHFCAWLFLTICVSFF